MPGKSGDCMEGFSKNGELSSNTKNGELSSNIKNPSVARNTFQTAEGFLYLYVTIQYLHSYICTKYV